MENSSFRRSSSFISFLFVVLIFNYTFTYLCNNIVSLSISKYATRITRRPSSWHAIEYMSENEIVQSISTRLDYLSKQTLRRLMEYHIWHVSLFNATCRSSRRKLFGKEREGSLESWENIAIGKYIRACFSSSAIFSFLIVSYRRLYRVFDSDHWHHARRTHSEQYRLFVRTS